MRRSPKHMWKKTRSSYFKVFLSKNADKVLSSVEGLLLVLLELRDISPWRLLRKSGSSVDADLFLAVFDTYTDSQTYKPAEERETKWLFITSLFTPRQDVRFLV